MNLEFYRIIGNILTEGIEKSYKAGLASVVKLNKKEILRLKDNEEPELFKINYTGTDKELLEYFKTEAFEIAAVSSEELEEKLKKLAVDIIEGNHPLAKGEKDIKELWIAEAQNLIGEYVPVADMPPPSYLNTNLQTAMNSAYHGSRFNRLQDPSIKGLYPAYQYKTRKDAKVREEHRALDDKIFYADDEIWKSILPPNGWNCRCYYDPLSQDEVNIDSNVVEPITSPEERIRIIKEARIAKNFNNNSVIHRSIYGAWLDEKGKALGIFESIKAAYKNSISTEVLFKDKSQLNRLLDYNVEPFRYIEPTQENWDKEFMENKIKVFGIDAYFKNDLKIKDREGTFTCFEKIIELGKKDGRHNYIGLIKPTLERPLMIIKNERGALVFVKSFSKDDKRVDYCSITFDKGDLLEIVSAHRKHVRDLLNELTKGEVLYFYAFASKSPGRLSRNTYPPMPVFNEFNSKLQFGTNNFNEVWSNTAFKNGVNNIKVQCITYRPDGFEIIKIKNGKESKPFTKDYSELDAYREGVII